MEWMFKAIIKKMSIKENKVIVKELIEELKKFDENMEVKLVKRDNMGDFRCEIDSIKINKGSVELN